jgi:subtilisin-like proprotein convertase family protein
MNPLPRLFSPNRAALGKQTSFCGGLLVLLFILALSETVLAQGKGRPPGNLDIRVNPPATGLPGVTETALAKSKQAIARNLSKGISQLKGTVRGGEVTVSPITGSAEVVSAADSLTAAAPNRPGWDIVKDFVQANTALYGLTTNDVANLRFIGESVSQASGLRMVRVEQMVNGRPVFQSETRFIIDREGRLIRSVGLLVPDTSAAAVAPINTVSAQNALVSAMASVNLVVDPARMTLANTKPDGNKTEVVANHPRISGNVPSELVYFPIAPGVLVLAWSQVTMTEGEGDWYTLVEANTGTLLWRKNIRAHVSTHEARFSVYVQADGKTPTDSPAPLSPTTATTGSGLQPAGIARTTVNMSVVQNITASPNGWITDGGTTTTGNNVDAYMDADNPADSPDTSLFFKLDGVGRPIGNPDTAARNRDFLGTTPRDFTMTPPPQGGNPESGQTATGNGNNGGTAIDAFRRGAVTHLFYIANWYHDQLFALGFDEAAGNFQAINFSGQGTGNDRVLAEAQDGSGTDNANFSTPPDGQSGRMQMYRFIGPTIDRDGGLDAEIVIHELTHGLSNRLIGNGAGLNWGVGGGMGEGWSDFYALSLLNNSNADDPNGKYAAGAYATYKAFGFTSYLDNYLYGIRRFPYSTDNSINPLTWADVDDVTFNLAGGIVASPLNFSAGGACEVHNIGEIWCNTLWEVRSRVIADPAGANGDVPTGNNKMLQIVTDGMKMTPINPSFIDARDALIAADAAANGGTNEIWIWQGFADRGLGYNAVAPFSRMFGWIAGHETIGESFDVPYLDVHSIAISDSLGNNNGAIDPGEPVKITVKLKNPWRKASFGVASATAMLTTSTPGVTIMTGTSTYPAIPALGNADGSQFKFTVPSSATAGQALSFTITPTSSLGTRAVNFTLRVGTPAGNGAPITYTKAAGALAIPDNSARGVVSTLTITDDHEIADLNFQVDSLTHTAVGDLTLLVRAPNGLGIDLISAVGGGSDGGPGNNFLNTVIDDQASGDLLLITAASAPFTGSWKPTFNNASWSSFGFPHDPTGTLSRYNGLSTKGDWKVVVSDQGAADTGTLNTWSLIVTPKAYTVTPFVAPSLTISGAAAYAPTDYPPSSPSAKKVEDVTVNLTGNASGNTLTASDGTYSLSGVPYGGNYCIVPDKTNDSPTVNGVSVLDIGLVRQHLLSPGSTTLTTPYKLLAADVNNSSNITILDIAFLRQVILGNTNRFPAGLWRFVPYEYAFPDALNPWGAPSTLCETDLIANATGDDLVAIKLGDLNDSWTPPPSMSLVHQLGKANVGTDAAANRAVALPQVAFEVTSHAVQPSQTVTATVMARGFRQVTGAQFTLVWDPAVLRFAGFGNFGLRGLSAGNFGSAMVGQGRLAFAWDDPLAAGLTLDDGVVVFSVSFQIIGEANSSSDLTFGDTPTMREVGVNFAAGTFVSESGQVSVGPVRPNVRLVGHADGQFRLAVPTVSGQRYVLEFADSLPTSSWTPLSTMTGDGSVKLFFDPGATNHQRYYRVRLE